MRHQVNKSYLLLRIIPDLLRRHHLGGVDGGVGLVVTLARPGRVKAVIVHKPRGILAPVGVLP
jgi:hypothetical protein